MDRTLHRGVAKFRKKILVKSARWFNLHEAISKGKHEHWILKMILKHYHKTPVREEVFIDPFVLAVKNPKKELADIRGGMMETMGNSSIPRFSIRQISFYNFWNHDKFYDSLKTLANQSQEG